MNKNILIVLGGAILVAVLVAVLVQAMLGGQKKAPEVVSVAKAQVLVASQKLAIGHVLKEGDTKWQEWPKESVFAGAVVREGNKKPLEALEGRLAREVAAGEPIMKSAMLGQESGNLVAASLEPGQRALAIGISASGMAGGFIGPGDFVDVILTYKESVKVDKQDQANPAIKKMMETNLNRYATETILQNVKVLAVDQRSKRPEDNAVKLGKTVTLALNSQDAERLALATELGDLTLVLRGVGDDAIVVKEWPIITDARLTNMDNEFYEEYEKIKKDSGINANNVRIYKGENVTTIPAR